MERALSSHFTIVEVEHTRLVKIFMRLPDGNISAAHPNVPYNGLIRQRYSLLAWRLEITVRCLYPDDFVRCDTTQQHKTHISKYQVDFRQYYNHSRTHASLSGNTPAEISGDSVAQPATLKIYAWRKHCGGLFQLPVAA